MSEMMVFILGPTASGKSAVSAEFAYMIGGEVVSCDSMQVYRDIPIITQQPGPEYTSKVRHHLTGIVPIEKEFNAAVFCDMASKAVDDIVSAGRMPVITGGTGLYVKAFVDGLFPTPPRDKDIREKLEKQSIEKGPGYIYEKLKRLDPESALDIDPRNERRVIRALEVFELTGKTFSEKKKETRRTAGNFNIRFFALEVPRRELVERINRRVDEMFSGGVLEETERIKGVKISLTASKAIGLEELMAYHEGKVSLSDAKEKIKIRTRQYAKRQMTWLRADKRVEWISPGEEPCETAAHLIRLCGQGSK